MIILDKGVIIADDTPDKLLRSKNNLSEIKLSSTNFKKLSRELSGSSGIFGSFTYSNYIACSGSFILGKCYRIR